MYDLMAFIKVVDALMLSGWTISKALVVMRKIRILFCGRFPLGICHTLAEDNATRSDTKNPKTPKNSYAIYHTSNVVKKQGFSGYFSEKGALSQKMSSLYFVTENDFSSLYIVPGDATNQRICLPHIPRIKATPERSGVGSRTRTEHQ